MKKCKKLVSVFLAVMFVLLHISGAQAAGTYTYINLPTMYFPTTGGWIMQDEHLAGWPYGDGTGDASASFNVAVSGSYKVWCNARDFQTDRPGTRKFKVKVDNTISTVDLGMHGKEGFSWEPVGVYNLTAGAHTVSLVDKYRNFARCKGIFITNDLDCVPTDDVSALNEAYPPYHVTDAFPTSAFPTELTGAMTQETVTTLESNNYKIDFFKGIVNGKTVVQNAFYVKNLQNNTWVQVKDRAEEYGFLMMRADKSELRRDCTLTGAFYNQTITHNNQTVIDPHNDFFKSGYPYWFIPKDIQRLSDKSVQLLFDTLDGTELTATYTFDDFVKEPKLTLNAKFNQKGAYSFLIFNGSGFEDGSLENVTAPLLYGRKLVPTQMITMSEEFLTIPMVTYTVNNKLPGQHVTYGLAVDPTVIPQDVAYPHTARFGYSLRNQDGKMRAQLTAPMFGTEGSNFNAGDTYSFSVRLLADVGDWYDTFKHVTQDMYAVADVRENYYAGTNEAIYNTTEFLMDDLYGGWDKKSMGYYYAESPQDEGHTNLLEEAQRYLLTEDEALLESRVIPTIAFMLSRRSGHFTRDVSGTSGTIGNPDLVLKPSLNGRAEYQALYRMSQGRMAFLENPGNTVSDNGVANHLNRYQMTGSAEDLQKVKQAADAIITNIDSDRFRNCITVAGNSGFILGDYTKNIDYLLAAYEVSGESKYLTWAEYLGRLVLTTLSGKGYHNGYDSNTYHVDPQSTAAAHVIQADTSNWWWHGKIQWRRGFEYGTWGPLEGTVSKIHEEDVPGWLPATVGLSTEHPRTAGHANFITMNAWASSLLRLAEYTGDELFEIQARNAFVGRYSTYPGYYIERYWTNYMKKEYPYEGPEYNVNYYTHTAQFLAMLEDFLITTAWSKSNGAVSFPQLTIANYSYFNNKQYGHEPGRMYDVDGLWMWNAPGIMTADNQNIDFIAGRKNGTLGLALINQAGSALTTEITLGEAIPAGYTGTADVYSASGTKSQISVTNGKFSITIPAKGMQTVLLSIPGITNPEYVRYSSFDTAQPDQTMASHTNGKGYVIQLNDKAYYGYVFVTDKDLKALTVSYTANGETKQETITEYPFETIVKVEDVSEPFEYSLTATLADDTTASYGGGTLKPLSYAGDVFVEMDGAEIGVFKQAAKNGGIAVSDTDFLGNTITEATVSDALYTKNLLPVTNGKLIVYLNQQRVLYPDKTYIKTGDVIQTKLVGDGFEPYSWGDVTTTLTAIGSNGVRLKLCFKPNKYPQVSDKTKIHINGYGLPRTAGGVDKLGTQNGYLLFENVAPHSVERDDSERIDIYVSEVGYASKNSPEQYQVRDGDTIVGVQPYIMSDDLYGYHTNNIYFTDRYTDGKLCAFDNGTHHLITTDGTVDCVIIRAKYNEQTLTGVSYEKTLLTFNEPKIITPEPDERIFIWKNEGVKGTNMKCIKIIQ